MKDSAQFRKYERDIQKIQNKIDDLTKVLASEKREFAKKRNLLQMAKQNTRKTSSLSIRSDKAAIKKRKFSLSKENRLKKEKDLQHIKIKKLNEKIMNEKVKIRQLRIEQKAYSKAGSHFQKEWRNYLRSKNLIDNQDLVSYENKVISAQVRAARALLDLSKQKFANALNINESLLSELERPKAKSIFETELIKNLFENIESLGVEIIYNGFYVSVGGVGARLKGSSTYVSVAGPEKLAEKSKKEAPKFMRESKPNHSKVA